MVIMEMGSSSLVQENKIGIMDGDDHVVGYHDDDSLSSDVSSLLSSDNESDDAFDETNSSSGSSPSSDPHHPNALGDMSDLLQQLPFKRGLSKHFQGKSQSFTSLSKVMCLEDLAKPENPYNKKMKSCKSYVGLSRVLPPPTRSASSSKLFNKKLSSRASCSSIGAGRNGNFLGLSSSSSRPPTQPPHRNGATSAF